MARGRMISKSWSTSKKRAAIYRESGKLAEFCLQLFPLLVIHSDDYGRFDGDAESVKLKCDPGSPRPVADFEAALVLLCRIDLIQRYVVDGQTWLQIVKFDDHQPGLLSKRTKPTSPEYTTDTELPGNSVLTKPNLIEPNVTELKKNVSAETSSAPPDAGRGISESRPTHEDGQGRRVARPQPFLEFPVVGSGPGVWPLSEAQVAEWVELYPGLDVRGESRMALAWVNAHKGRRKTAGGMEKFLVAWMNRAVNAGHSRGREHAAGPVGPMLGKRTSMIASALQNIINSEPS